MALKPLGRRVLVRRNPPKDRTAGGLHIPLASREISRQGKVIAAGDKCTDLKGGEEVLLPLHGGDPIRIDNEDLLLYGEQELSAIILAV